MFSVAVEVVWRVIKGLFRYLGFIIIFLAVFIVCAVTVPKTARRNASFDVKYAKGIEFVSLEEVQSDSEGDRCFKVKVRNHSSYDVAYPYCVVRSEDGNMLYDTIETDFEDLELLKDPVQTFCIPPAEENIIYIYLSEISIEGVSKIYISDDTKSDDNNNDNYGTGFEIVCK